MTTITSEEVSKLEQESANLQAKFTKWIEQHNECIDPYAHGVLESAREKLNILEQSALMFIGAQFLTYQPGDCDHDHGDDEDVDVVLMVTLVDEDEEENDEEDSYDDDTDEL